MTKDQNNDPRRKRRPLTEEEKRKRAAMQRRANERKRSAEGQEPRSGAGRPGEKQGQPQRRSQDEGRTSSRRQPAREKTTDRGEPPRQQGRRPETGARPDRPRKPRSEQPGDQNEFRYQPNEPLEEGTAYQSEPPKKKRHWVKWLILLLFLLLLIIGGMFTFVIATGGFGEEKDVEVMIPDGATQTEVAEILEDNDVVFSSTLFKAYLRLTGGGDNIRSGRYQFKTSSGFPDVKQQLSEGYSGDEVVGQVTVPEGSNIDDIAGILAGQFNVSKEQMLELISDDALFDRLDQAYPELLEGVADNDEVRYKLEGYLFPSTYSLTENDTPESVIEMMVASMEQIRQKYEGYIAQSDFSLHQILTLASLIEGEAAHGEDRRLISGVFLNRLADDMPIQSDVTVNYANDRHETYVTIEDTQTDSPYNLYQNTGLGPGPFNSPSEESIEAALKPEKNDYLYFVADLQTGEVYYSKTYEEHMKKVDKYISEENATLNQPENAEE